MSGPSRERYFRTSVEAILKNWTALQLAVHQGSAGQDSRAIAEWLVEATLHYFASNKDLTRGEVVDFFESILYTEMHLLIEDGSTEEVATLLLDFYVKCIQSNLSEEQIVAAIRTLPRCDLTKCQVGPDPAAMDEDGDSGAAPPLPQPVIDSSALITGMMEGMETEEPTKEPKPGPDPDGWEVVRKKR